MATDLIVNNYKQAAQTQYNFKQKHLFLYLYIYPSFCVRRFFSLSLSLVYVNVCVYVKESICSIRCYSRMPFLWFCVFFSIFVFLILLTHCFIKM